jgi:hypothetical protein
MNFYRITLLSLSLLITNISFAGPNYISGKITSLSASATDPAIRLTGNVSPELCNGGTYGWLYFVGTPEERNRVYSTALALSMTGKNVDVYTNSDGAMCRIGNIQALGLN